MLGLTKNVVAFVSDILHKGTTFGVSDMLLSMHLEKSEQHRSNLWKLQKDKLSTCGESSLSEIMLHGVFGLTILN